MLVILSGTLYHTLFKAINSWPGNLPFWGSMMETDPLTMSRLEHRVPKASGCSTRSAKEGEMQRPIQQTGDHFPPLWQCHQFSCCRWAYTKKNIRDCCVLNFQVLVVCTVPLLCKKKCGHGNPLASSKKKREKGFTVLEEGPSHGGTPVDVGHTPLKNSSSTGSHSALGRSTTEWGASGIELECVAKECIPYSRKANSPLHE